MFNGCVALKRLNQSSKQDGESSQTYPIERPELFRNDMSLWILHAFLFFRVAGTEDYDANELLHTSIVF